MAADDDVDVETQSENEDLQDQQGVSGIRGALPTSTAFTPRGPGVLSPYSSPAPTPAPAEAPRAAIGGRAKGFNPDDFVSTGERYTMPALMPAEPNKDAGKGSFPKDIARGIWASTLQSAAQATGVAGFAANQFDADPQIQDMIKSGRRWLEDRAAGTIADMSPEHQTALRASLFSGGETGPDGSRIPTVGEAGFANYAAYTAASLVPGALIALIGTPFAAAVTFGAAGAGGAFTEFQDQIDKAPDATLMAHSPAYKTLRTEQGMSESAAKLQILRMGAPSLVAMGGAAGAAGGYGLGGAGGGVASRLLGKGLTSRIVGGALEGGVPMAAQGGVDEDVRQSIGVSLGQPDAYDPMKIAKETMKGALGGALMGGALGAVHSAPKAPEAKPTTPEVDPALSAAATEALGPTKPTGPSPPSFVPPGTQPRPSFVPPGEGAPPGQAIPPPRVEPPTFVPPDTTRPAPTGPSPAFVPPADDRPATNGAPPFAPPGTQPRPAFVPPGESALPGPTEAPPRAEPPTFIPPDTTRPAPTGEPPAFMPPGQTDAGGAEGVASPAPPVASSAPPVGENAAPIAAQTPTITPTKIPAKVPVKAPAKPPAGKKQLIKALTAAGQDPEMLATQGLGDLKAMYAAHVQSTGKPEVTTVGKETAPAAPPESTPRTTKQVQVQDQETEAKALRTAGYDRNPDDPLQGRLDHIRERLADPALPEGTREELTSRAKEFEDFLAEREEALKDAPPEHQAAVRRLKVDDRVSGPNRKGDDVSGPIIGWGHDGSVGVQDSEGITHDIHVSKVKPDTVAKTPAAPKADELRAEMQAKIDAAKAKEVPSLESTPAPITRTLTPAEKRAQQKFKLKAPEPKAKAKVETPPEEQAVIDRVAAERDAHNVERARAIKAVQKPGMTVDEQLKAAKAAGDAINAKAAAEHPEYALNDKQLADAVAKLGTLDNLKPDDWHTAIRDTRPVERIASRGKPGAREDVEDKLEREEQAEQEREAESGVTTGDALDTAAVHEEATAKPKVTDHARIANDLIERLNDGDITPHEAAAIFDKPEGGSKKGAPRREELTNMITVLEHEARRAEDPAAAEKWKAKVAADQAADDAADAKDARDAAAGKTVKPREESNTKRARTLAIGRELERLGPAYAEKVRGWVRELTDTVGVAADKEAAKDPTSHNWTPPADTPGGHVDPRNSQFVRNTTDQRLGEGLARAIDVSERNGVPFSLNDALKLIRNSSLLRAAARPQQMLATQLLRLRAKLPDIAVRSMSHAIDEGVVAPDAAGSYGQFNYGASPAGDHIAINTGEPHQHGNHVTTLLHEASHSITGRLIQDMIDHYHRTGEMPAELRALELIHGELASHVREAMDTGGLSKLEGDNLLNALQDPHELHTMLMTDPVVQGFAASRQASPEFLKALRDLGYDGKPKSIWRSFVDWTRRAMGLHAPASASEYTFLDHVWAPISDIAEKGARYNERFLPKDPELRGPATVASRAATDAMSWSPRARDALGRLARVADSGTWGARARAAVMEGTTTDALVDRYEHLVGPSLAAFRDAQEAIQRSQTKFLNEHGDTVRKLGAEYNQNPEAIKLGQLMTDTTRANVKLGEPDVIAANPHITDPEQQAEARALNDRYKNLSPVSRGLYQAFKAIHGVFYKQKREAELNALMRGAVPDATPEQLKAFADTVRSRKSLDAFMDKPENSAIAKELGADKFQGYKAVLRGIAKVYAHGFVEGDYFPLVREGKYVVTYGHPGEADHGVEMFHSVSEAEARRAELAKTMDAEDRLSHVQLKRESATSELMPHHPAVDELVGAMQKRGMGGNAEEVRNLLNSILLEHLSRSTAGSAKMRRKGVRGALADHAKILADSYLNTSGSIGYLEHGQDRFDALGAMSRRIDQIAHDPASGKSDALVAEALRQELQKRASVIENPHGLVGSLGRTATNLSYVLNVQSPSHMIFGSIEAHSNAVSHIGGEHGFVKAGLALTRALAQASPKMLKTGVVNSMRALGGKLESSDWNLGHYVRDRFIEAGANKSTMHRLFAALENIGLIDHTQSADIRRMANPTGVVATKAGDLWQRFADFNTAGAHAVDVMNKGVIAKAAFDLMMSKTKGDVDRSIAHSIEMLRRSMPNYNLGNKARAATAKGSFGPLGVPMMQFKNYGLHEIGTIVNLARRSFGKMPPEERWKARKALAGILATRAMAAGTLTLLGDPLRYVGGAYDFATGADKPHDYENDVREWANGLMGKQLGAIFSRGLPEAIGWDGHRRTGLTNMLEIPEISSFNKKEMLGALGTAVFGATGENAVAMAEGMSKMLHGDILGGLTPSMPRIVRDPIKAINLANQGVMSAGKNILPPDKLSSWDIASQAFGIQPSRVSEVREANAAVKERIQETASARTKLIKQWVDAAPADRMTVMHQIHDFTQDPKHAGVRITQGDLMRAANDRKKQANLPLGIKLPKRGGAAMLEAGSFANY